MPPSQSRCVNETEPSPHKKEYYDLPLKLRHISSKGVRWPPLLIVKEIKVLEFVMDLLPTHGDGASYHPRANQPRSRV